MVREELQELHFISVHANLRSIHANGILCFKSAAPLAHTSIAMPEIQLLRSRVKIPQGLDLHAYANLYFHARNPMMFVRRHMYETLAVVQVRPEVLDLANA